jgi:site-specific recombinase XerD
MVVDVPSLVPSLAPEGALSTVPPVVADSGPAALFVWEEFVAGQLRNRHTRSAYLAAIRRFLEWVQPAIQRLEQITPGQIGRYLDQHPGSPPTKKLALAALRKFFDLMVLRHIIILNPAASVRSDRYQSIEGKTPAITTEQIRQLIAAIDTTSRVGLRDRACIGVLAFTAARAGAVANIRRKDLVHEGGQYILRFRDKGGKDRAIPVRFDLERFLLEYLESAGLTDAAPDSFLFRSALRRTGELSDRPITGADICRMLKRRLKDAALPTTLSPHSFRVYVVTDLLSQGIALADVQYLAGHSDPRTTRLYDRRERAVSRSIVERISI